MKLYRNEVPVNDQWILMFPVMDPLYVGCRETGIVEFWSWEPHDGPWPERYFRVYGTGQEIPADVRYWGTAVAPDSTLVWHLVEATGELAMALEHT